MYFSRSIQATSIDSSTGLSLKGATENAGVEKSARSKMQWWKMRELTSVQWQ